MLSMPWQYFYLDNYFENKRINPSVLVLLTCYRGYSFPLSLKKALSALASDCEHILPFLIQAPCYIFFVRWHFIGVFIFVFCFFHD